MLLKSINQGMNTIKSQLFFETISCSHVVIFLSLFCPDMIPENALEEITKKLDPNLVIAVTKEDVQLK